MIIGDAKQSMSNYDTNYIELDFRDPNYTYVLNSVVFQSPFNTLVAKVFIDDEEFLSSTGEGTTRTATFGGIDVSGKVVRFQWQSVYGHRFTTNSLWKNTPVSFGMLAQFVSPEGKLTRGVPQWEIDLEFTRTGVEHVREPLRGEDNKKTVVAGYVSDGLLDGWFQQPYITIMTNQFGNWLMDDAGYEIPPQPGTYYPPSRGRGYPRPI